jgi:hypothetical protein
MRGVLILVLLCAGGVRAQEVRLQPGAEPLKIPRVTRPPKLSDFLENVPREAELVVTDFRQYMPGDGVPVSQPTTAYLSYDDKNIYCAFICKDDPKLIRARVAKREQIMNDDRFNLCIDTFHDHRHMYWFDINPYGVQADGNVTDGVEDDPSWDTLWQSDARITADGYVGLAAIPFKSLRFPDDKEQTWGLILGRWIMRNNEFSLWPSVSRQRPGFVRQGGDMSGIHDISPGRNIQLIPYGLLGYSKYLDDTPQYVSKFERRAGLDAKFVIKDAFTLDLALNPDFSQVESDEPQVTVNQRFEVYFPEKRPFFMENQAYFKTPQQLFFSRRIIDPRYGARLTGKEGKWSLGVIATDDRGPGEVVSKDDPRSGSDAAVGVVRIQRELGKNSNAAIMATSEDFGSTHNRVLSYDTRLQVLANWALVSQLMTSDTKQVDGTHLSGPAYFVSWQHSGKHFTSDTSYTDRSPSFRADLGYFNRVDIRQLSQTTGYKWRPESKLVTSFGPVLKALINYDRQGRLQDWVVNPEFSIELTRMTEITVERWEGFELYENIGFRLHNNEFQMTSQWWKWLEFQAGFANGESINYYPATGIAPFSANMKYSSAGFTLRPTPKIRIDETYIYSGLKTFDGAGIFGNHIARSKFNYQFNRATSLRCIVDYNSILPNSTLVDLEKTKHVGLDLLFTHMLNPGTALHVGYTDLYENMRFNPTVLPALMRTSFPDLNTGKQFFVKLSYLLRF